jgi:Tfp pilus assembly protein PilF/O-antigen ligase
MPLSNRKRKQVRALAGRLSVAEIAAELDVPAAEVAPEVQLWRDEGGQPSTPAMPWLGRGIALLILVGPLVWIGGLYDFSDVPKGMLIQAGTLALLACWLVSVAMAGTLQVRSSQILLPLVACLAWIGVALAYAHNRYEGYWYLFRWLPALPVVLIGATVLREAAWRRTVLLAVGASGALAALLGALQTLIKIDLVEQVQPPSSTFANRNMAVDFIVLSLSVAVGWALDDPRPWRRRLAAVAVMVILFFIAATGCRAGWMSAALQAVFWAGFLGWRWWRTRDLETLRRIGWIAAAATVAVSAALFTPEVRKIILIRSRVPVEQVMEQVQRTNPGEGAESSIVWRIRTWRNTLGMIHDHWLLGVGLGNHKVLYPLYHRRGVVVKSFDEKKQLAHVHNDFLQMWAETGLVGMLLGLWLLVATLRACRANFARIAPEWPSLTWAIPTTIVGGFMVSAFFSFPAYRAGPPLILAGLLAVVAAGGAESSLRTWRVPRNLAAAGAGLVAVILAVYLFWAWHFLQADRLHRLVISADAQKRWDLVIRFGREALKHDPWRMKTQFYVGRALAESKRSQEAVVALEEVLVSYPHYLNAWYNLGLAYGDAKDDPNAIRSYREVIAIKPDFSLAHNNLGCIQLRLGQVDDADASFRAAAEADPGNALAWNNLGLTSIRRKALPEAAEHFEKAIELDANAMLAHKNLGILYVQYLNRPDEGVVHLRRALELDPKMPEGEAIRNMLKAYDARSSAPAPKAKTPVVPTPKAKPSVAIPPPPAGGKPAPVPPPAAAVPHPPVPPGKAPSPAQPLPGT